MAYGEEEGDRKTKEFEKAKRGRFGYVGDTAGGGCATAGGGLNVYLHSIVK